MEKLYLCNCNGFVEITDDEYQLAQSEEGMGYVMLVVASNPEEARHRYQAKMLHNKARCQTIDVKVNEIERVDGYHVHLCHSPLMAIRREEVIKPMYVFSQDSTVPNYLVCERCREVLWDDEIQYILSNPALHKRYLLNYTYCPYCGQRIKGRG